MLGNSTPTALTNFVEIRPLLAILHLDYYQRLALLKLAVTPFQPLPADQPLVDLAPFFSPNARESVDEPKLVPPAFRISFLKIVNQSYLIFALSPFSFVNKNKCSTPCSVSFDFISHISII